jgi:carbamoyl-phosphate synthase large subunit
MTVPDFKRRGAASFRELDSWILAMDLVTDVYAATATFPREERFGLTSQIRRAAVSIPANIAEGKARFGAGEYRRFVSIALGSVAELQTELEIALRLGFIETPPAERVLKKLDHVGRKLTTLAKSLSR